MFWIKLRAKSSINIFFDIVDYLNKDDILILNNTKVIPARLLGKKETGAKIEIFLTRPFENNIWSALIRNSKRLKENDIVIISDELKVLIKEKKESKKSHQERSAAGDYLASAASSMDCPGLIPPAPPSRAELEAYEEMYPFLPPVEKAKKKDP